MTHCPPGNPKMTPRQAMVLWTTLAVAITLYVAFAWWALSRPVPFCKIVDGREINNHRCIPYCPPDPRECGD